jgi:hypothetical protein
MIKLKSTHEILTMPWKESTNCIPIGGKIPPTWKGNTPLTINDIHFWEELYHEPGNIGVYISWSPYEEFYMIAYNLFATQPFGTKTFYGSNAALEVVNTLSKLRIDLPINKIWIR